MRTETATNNISTDYGIGKAVQNLPQWQRRLDGIIDRYLDVQQDILETARNFVNSPSPRFFPTADASLV